MTDNDGKVIDFVNNKSIKFADYLKEDEYLEFITLDTLKRLNKNSKQGVMSLQRQYGLNPDGIVGHDTFSVIFEYLDGQTASEVIEHMKSEGYYMDKNDDTIKKRDKKNKSKLSSNLLLLLMIFFEVYGIIEFFKFTIEIIRNLIR